MDRAGMNNENPNQFEMTGTIPTATMRAVDTTMHTEENFLGTSDRNLLNASTFKENHNLFSDRSIVAKNLFNINM